MKQIAIILLELALALTASAQVDRDAYERQRRQMREQYRQELGHSRQRYDAARRKAEAEYAAFRKKANEEYAAAVQQAWALMDMNPAVPKPKEPAPPRPPKPAIDRIPTTIHLPQAEIVPAPTKLGPVPVPPIPETAEMEPTMQFDLYGTPCNVHADVNNLRFKLSAVDEKGVAAAWQQLSNEKYDGLLHDCLAQKETLRLSDWGYLCLLRSMSEQLLGKGSNEAVLMQMYLMVQSGYRVRIARTSDKKLTLLVPFNKTIFNYPYFTIDGIPHYAIDANLKGGVSVCNVAFPREQVANILMGQMPELGGANATAGQRMSRTFQAEKFSMMKATVAVDKSLIDYLNEYPLSNAWDYYALAGLSDGVKADLYPALRKQIEGRSRKKAAAMLLDFVQTAFAYATDQEQFGYERPLFGDESIYYPKNDCEDRSIIYSILVRDLLGLDVVLVHWPGHLGTAVAFDDEVDGDFFVVDGRRYTVCDPTYIGATIGETMPQFQGEKATLVRL